MMRRAMPAQDGWWGCDPALWHGVYGISPDDGASVMPPGARPTGARPRAARPVARPKQSARGLLFFLGRRYWARTREL
jgi:hypothetical protein